MRRRVESKALSGTITTILSGGNLMLALKFGWFQKTRNTRPNYGLHIKTNVRDSFNTEDLPSMHMVIKNQWK